MDHTAGVPAFRRKYSPLAAYPDIQLTVLAPDRWVENYREVHASPGGEHGYTFLTGRVGWPGYENRAHFLSGLGRAIRRASPDILHLWEEPFSVIALQALALAKVWAPRAKPIFFTADNLGGVLRYPYRPAWFYAWNERFAHGACAGATALSEEVADVLRAEGFAKPIEVIPLGLDLRDYGGAGPDPAKGTPRASADEARARFGLAPPIVGYAGRLLPVKGVDVLLHAAAAMGDSRPSVVIVGEGPERESLESLASRLGIAASVRFLPMVPHGEMPGLLSMIDVLVLPSRTLPRSKEQFGRILIEGMAAGCTVIGSTSGAIPSVLGDAGLVFEEGSTERLANAIRRVIGDPGLGASLRARGDARVRDRYTWEAIAGKLVAFYRRLLAPGC